MVPGWAVSIVLALFGWLPIIRAKLCLTHLRAPDGAALDVVRQRPPSLSPFDEARVVSNTLSGSRASLSIPGKADIAEQKYIRLWIYNTGLLAAESCIVFVQKILFGGKVIGGVRSAPLHWSGTKGQFSCPRLVHGFKNGRWVDLCAADEDGYLELISELRLKQREHKFTGYGRYELTLVAEHSRGSTTTVVTVEWEGLKKSVHVASER